MCGIVGIMTFNGLGKEKECIRREVMMYLFERLLRITVERGQDATGVAALFADGNFVGLKMGISSVEFVARHGGTENDYEGFSRILYKYEQPINVLLGHCRKATVGSANNNNNNQPVQADDTIVIHNGTIENHKIIFERMKFERTGEVDSEVIAKLITEASNNGKNPYTASMMEDISSKLSGSYSVLGFNGNNPFQVFQLKSARPAELVLIKPLKMVVVASDRDFLKKALLDYNILVKSLPSAWHLPYLKTQDMEFEGVAENTFRIWNLQTLISDNTKLQDLYEKGKVMETNKDFKSSTDIGIIRYTGKSTYYNYDQEYQYKPQNYNSSSYLFYNGYERNAISNNHTQKQSNSHVENEKDKERKAFVWSKRMEKYVSSEKYVTEDKNIEVDLQTGKINSQEEPEKTDNMILMTDFNSKEVDDSIEAEGVPVEISTLHGEKELTQKNDALKNDALSEAEEYRKLTQKNVALLKAREYADSVKRFDNDVDLMFELDIDDKTFLNSIKPFALANRIIKYFSGKFFYDGYINCLKNLNSKTMEDIDSQTPVITLTLIGKILDKLSQKDLEKYTKVVLGKAPTIVKTASLSGIDEYIANAAVAPNSFYVIQQLLKKFKNKKN